MTSLVATLTGWRGTARSVRWSPLVATPLFLCAAIIVVEAAMDPSPADIGVLGEWGLAFTAAGAAFLADDATREAAPATPVGARARMAARAALAGPVVVAGWVLILLVYDAVTPAAVTADVPDRALAGVGLGAAALGLATLGDKVRAVTSPGAVGVGATACLAVASQSVPERWLAALPPPAVLWPVTVLVAVATAVVAEREPVR